MALGKRSSDNQFSGAGSPPPPPPPPPTGPAHVAPPPEATPVDPQAQHDAGGTEEPRAADVVTALDARLQELQATVAALVDKSVDPESLMAPHPAPEAPEPVTLAPGELDPDVLEASRTLQMAKRTADAMLAEAREEAAEITRVAREQADREFDTQREALAAEQLAWERRRAELVELFEELDRLLGSHRTQVDRAHEVVQKVLSGPVAEPIIDTPAAPQPVFTTPPAPEFSPEQVAPVAEAIASVDAGGAPLFGDPQHAGADTPSDSTGFRIVTPPDGEPAAPDSPPDGPRIFGAPPEGETFGTPPEPAPDTPPAPPATPFYPWANQQPADAESSSDEEAAAPPPPPVQRRGLFGH